MNFFNLIHISFGSKKQEKEQELYEHLKQAHKIIKLAQGHIETNQVDDKGTHPMLKEENRRLFEYFKKMRTLNDHINR